MAYIIKPVERECIPKGRDWYFFERPNGDCIFAVAKDFEEFELDPETTAALVASLERQGLLGHRKAS